MPNVLLIEASPRDTSSSRALGAAFLQALSGYAETHVDRLDLWAAGLPEFDGAAIDAKYAILSGRALGTRETQAWADIRTMVERLDRADAVVIATPMWNFGIPYKLKQWIDLVTQPGLTFRFDTATGYTPLLRPRPVAVILASAGDYATGTSRGRPDLATPYLAAALSFLGLRGPVFVASGPSFGMPTEIEGARKRAQATLAGLAEKWGAAFSRSGTEAVS